VCDVFKTCREKLALE